MLKAAQDSSSITDSIPPKPELNPLNLQHPHDVLTNKTSLDNNFGQADYRCQIEDPENIDDSQLNNDFIQRPRKIRPTHFLQGIAERRMEANARIQGLTPSNVANGRFADVAVDGHRDNGRPEASVLPLPKPDLEGLVTFLEQKVSNMIEGPMQADTGVASFD